MSKRSWMPHTDFKVLIEGSFKAMSLKARETFRLMLGLEPSTSDELSLPELSLMWQQYRLNLQEKELVTSTEDGSIKRVMVPFVHPNKKVMIPHDDQKKE